MSDLSKYNLNVNRIMKKTHIDTDADTIQEAIFGSDEAGAEFFHNHLMMVARCTNEISREDGVYTHTAIAIRAFEKMSEEDKYRLFIYMLCDDVKRIFKIIEDTCECPGCSEVKAIYRGEQ